jgi:uncharacterized protein
MKIVIPGGSGQIGTLLARAFHARRDEVVVLSRFVAPAPWRVAAWDGRTLGKWTAELDGADVVINLAGRNVNCRYTTKRREEIMASRVNSTRVVGQAIAQARRPPKIWLQASTATIYAHRYDAANDEATGIPGGLEQDAPDAWRFSIGVAKAWEQAAREEATPRTRLVLLRSAMTMSPDRGGVFDTLSRFVRMGLGGTIGDGRQYMSWIHDRDFIRAIQWLIEHEELSGAVNLASPYPLPNAEFMAALRAAWGVPLGLPAVRWMLEISTFIMRTESELVLKSRRVVPRHLVESGFQFEFSRWPEAARDLCERLKQRSSVPRPARGGFDEAMTPARPV